MTGINSAIYSVKTPQGEYKSLEMHLKEQREQIARDIERQCDNVAGKYGTGFKCSDGCTHPQDAAIARGQK